MGIVPQYSHLLNTISTSIATFNKQHSNYYSHRFLKNCC